jgi:glycosyltransferase involved in cell wall biosynthesis
MRIAFVVGDVGTISGGFNVIIEYAAALQRRGHDVVIAPKDRSTVPTWHPRLAGLRVTEVAALGEENFDFAFATWWLTYFELSQLRSAVYGYLTQSLESRFHPEPHLKLLNRCTYALPLLMVTEASWLAELIRAVQPAARVLCIPNGLSRDYFPCLESPPERRGPLRVLVEGPWSVPFKGVPETFAALERARATGVPFEVGWLTVDAGGRKRPSFAGRPIELHERVPLDQVRHVLQRYDVLLKLSRVEGVYGPPLEMFSQGGTAITSTVTGSDEYMVHGHNGLLVEPYNERQIAEYLGLLASRRRYLATLRRNALATARRHPDWEASGAALADALEALAAEGWTNAQLRPALGALSALADRWTEDVRRLDQLGGSVRVLGDAVRRLKASGPGRAAKRILGRPLHARLSSRAKRRLR